MPNLEHFNQWMRDKYIDNDNIYWHYIDYRDTVPEDVLIEALKSENLYDYISDYAYFNDWYSYPFFECVDEYIHEENLEDEVIRDELLDYCDHNYTHEFDIDQLLRNTFMPEVTIIFGDNWDDDYNALSSFENDFEDLNEYNPSTLAQLIRSQGYKVLDVKHPTSPFLEQVRSECQDYLTELDGQQLVASVKTDDYKLLNDLVRGYPVTLKPGTTFGLFNQIHGSSAGFEIELEKPLTVNMAESIPIDTVIIGTHERYMDYTPYGVCGELIHKNQEDLETVK